jgi:hypothetical protein
LGLTNGNSKRDPERKFKLTDGHVDCFLCVRALVRVRACQTNCGGVSSRKNFSISTYVATAMSFIHQTSVTERGQRFLLATLRDTAGWGIRRYNEHFSVYHGVLFLFIQLQ